MTTTVMKPLSFDKTAAGEASHGDYRVYEEQCIADPAKPVSSSQYTRPGIGYVLAGWCDYRGQNGAITAVPGTVVFGNAGEQYDVDHDGCPGNRRIVARFSKAFFESTAEACDIDRPTFGAVGIPPGNAALKLFGCLMAAARGGEEGEDAAFELARAALAVTEACRRPQDVSGRDRRRVISAVRYVESCYSEPCSLDRLASISGVGRYRLIRLFMGVTGQSPHQYVINTRLRAAVIQLIGTRAPISAIALDVGFNDIPHFGRYFRNVFGCTPRQMRKNFAANQHTAGQASSRFELITLPPGHLE